MASFDAANLIPRRVPVPNLRPPLAICKPTGVTLSAGSRVVLMPDKNGAGDALTEQLQELGRRSLMIDGCAGRRELANMLKAWLAAGPVQGSLLAACAGQRRPLSRHGSGSLA